MENLGDSSLLFICKIAMEQKVTNLPSSFYRQLLCLPEPCPGALGPDGDWFALPPCPGCSCCNVWWGRYMVWETRQRPSSPLAEGLMLARPSHVLLAGCWETWRWISLGFELVRQGAMSSDEEKRDCLLPWVGLDDLMGYLSSVSQL